MALASVLTKKGFPTGILPFVYAYGSNGLVLPLLQKCIQKEVETRGIGKNFSPFNFLVEDGTVFRNDSFATSLMVSYSRLLGEDYLKMLSGKLDILIQNTSPIDVE